MSGPSRYDAVLEGGGTKIPALVGAVCELHRRGYEPYRVVGTSAGAIVASGLTAYTPPELRDIILDLDWRIFLDGDGWGLKTWNLLRHLGIYEGERFESFMRHLLGARGVRVFGDLKRNGDYAVRVLAADVGFNRLVTFPDDAPLYGLSSDALDVAWAVRCSMSIPGFFRPVPATRRDFSTYLVDGGILSNFPIWIFDSEGPPRWPTFGLLLQERPNRDPDRITGMVSMLLSVFRTMMKAHDLRAVSQGEYHNRTISIPVSGTSALEFDMPLAKKKALLSTGELATKNFLNNWSWEDYQEWAKTRPRVRV